MITRKLSLLLAATMLFAGTTAFTGADPEPDDGALASYVEGSIQLPTRFIDGESGWPGLVRKAWNCSAATNGTVGYVVDVYPGAWNGYFEISEVTDRTGAGDVDVYFYSEFGDCAGQADPVTVGDYQNDGPESGFVPEGATKAVFFTSEGVELSFTYVDHMPPVVDVAPGADLDRTVRGGTTLVFTNAGDGYLELESEGLGIDRVGDGRGIPSGDTFEVRVPSAAGAYTYTANGVLGTITVVDDA